METQYKIAVLDETGALNIHIMDINAIELRGEQIELSEDDDEIEAIESLLSDIYDLSSIQWGVINGINLKF